MPPRTDSEMRDSGSDCDALVRPLQAATVADVAPVVQQEEETQAAASVAGPVESGGVQGTATTATTRVPREHMGCHLGERCKDTARHTSLGEQCKDCAQYTSPGCFVSSVLAHDWVSYQGFVKEGAQKPSVPASDVGTGYESPSDFAYHVASLAWAEASAEIHASLHKCWTETGEYENAKGTCFNHLPEVGCRAAARTDMCEHCRTVGTNLVQVCNVGVGDEVRESPGMEWGYARRRNERPQATPGRRARDPPPLKEGMIAGVYTASAGSRLELAYVKTIGGHSKNRDATFVFHQAAYERLCRGQRQPVLRVIALYNTARIERMLYSFAGCAAEYRGAGASRVGGDQGLPALDVRNKMVIGFDPVLECLANPSVFYRVREECINRTKGRRGPPPSLGTWEGSFLQLCPGPGDPLTVRDDDYEKLCRMKAGRAQRAETIKDMVRRIESGGTLNEAQLAVLRDQMFAHLHVDGGRTRARRRMALVLGGGGVGKSTLMAPLISVYLATNRTTRGHPLSSANKRPARLLDATKDGGDALVGLFAEMNRSLDSCVASIMRPGALRTADDKDSRAKIFRVGAGCEDSRVQQVTLDFMASKPIKDLHPAWQEPPGDADSHEKANFEQFVKLRAKYKTEKEKIPRDRGGMHRARTAILAHLLKHADVIAATISAAASWEFAEHLDRVFNTAIVEECAKASAPPLLHLLTGTVGRKERVENVVVVGDHNQGLPYSSTKEPVPAAYLRRSLFGVVASSAPEGHVFFLNKQYRMHPRISRLASDAFYGGRLEDGSPAPMFKRAYHDDHRFPPLLFLDTADEPAFAERRADPGEPGEDTEGAPNPADERFSTGADAGADAVEKRDLDSETTSRANDGEAALCVVIAATLAKLYPCGGAPPLADATSEKPRVIIIAPYLSQKRCIEALVENERALREGRWEISVLTAERAQGEQADVVIVSTVRSQYETQNGSLRDRPLLTPPTASRARTRFVSQRNRLAVMCTRARYSLIFIGDSALLASSEEALGQDERADGLEPPWARLLAYCKGKGIYRRAVVAETMYKEPAVEATKRAAKMRKTPAS